MIKEENAILMKKVLFYFIQTAKLHAGADIHKTRYRTNVLDFNKRYRSATGHYHVYERGVPDIVLQHEKCIGHSVKVPGKCPLSGMDISPCC